MDDRELAIEVLSNCTARYINADNQADIDRAISLATTILTDGRSHELRRAQTDAEKFKDQVHWTLQRAEKAEADADVYAGKLGRQKGTIATLTAALEEARGALELTVRSLRELQRSTGLLNDADKTELEAALAALATINAALGRVEE